MGERAISVAPGGKDHARVVVDSLTLVGMAAAISDLGCNLLVANDRFVTHMSNRLMASLSGLRFTDREFGVRFREAADSHRAGGGTVESIALPGSAGSGPLAIHLTPLTGSPTGCFPNGAMLLLVTGFARASMPSMNLLRSLFALTPTEARIANHLVEGGSVADAAATLGIGKGTVRTHLKSVFAKTGVSRQSDLLRLLLSFAPPSLSSHSGTKFSSPPNGRGESQWINSS